MDKRKLFGTIIGLIFWSFCVIFFTYAYYDWKSDPTNIVLGIEDLSLECLVGANVETSNIGPVLNYQDGVKTEFSINNGTTDNMVIELYLDINSISDNLLTESFKYVLVADSTGGTNYDYNNPILEGDFSNFIVGNNLVTQDLAVTAEITTNYQFIIYIDGSMYNDPNMQENSLVGNLLIGKCSGDSIPYDELVYQAIYSETDNSLTFVHTEPLTVGDTYNDKSITAVYTGFDTATYTSQNNIPWYKDGNYQNITTVNFDSVIKPKSTANWFYDFNNLIDIDLTKLDTSNVTNTSFMFYNCNKLTELDVSNFNTSKVTNMTGMFDSCKSLIELDLSNFDTSNVTLFGPTKDWDTFGGMFMNCISLKHLDISEFNTKKSTSMMFMFSGCSSLVELDVSSFDTSNVTTMVDMFNGCASLLELDISNFNTSNVTKVSNYNGGKRSMFSGCSSLIELDISNFDISKLTNISFIFHNCSSLTNLDLCGWDTSNVTNMGSMFYGCSGLIELDLSNFDTSNVTSMSNMFNSCSSLITLKTNNKFVTSTTTSLNYMFSGCSSLVDLNTKSWDLSGVKSMPGIFFNCNKLDIELIINSNSLTSYSSFVYQVKSCIFYYVGDNPETTDIDESTYDLVESIIDIYGGVNGGCYGDYCPIVT